MQPDIVKKKLSMGILTNTPDKKETHMIADAAEDSGHRICILPLDMIALSTMSPPVPDAIDIIISRIDISSLSCESYHHAARVFSHIDNRMPVLNNSALLRKCQDKYETDISLKQAGLPVPESLAALSKPMARQAIDDLCIKYKRFVPLIFKPIYGCRGDGIRIAGTYEQAGQIIDFLPENEPVYFQRFLEKTGDRDLRIIVCQGIIFGAVTRIAKPGEAVTNTSKGCRSGFLSSLPEEIANIAQKASFAIGRGVLGVDIGVTSEGIYIWEVNACPDFARHESDITNPKWHWRVEDFIVRCAEAEYLNFYDRSRDAGDMLPFSIGIRPYREWIHEFVSL